MATTGGAGGDCGGSAGVGDDGPSVGDICGSSNPSWPLDTSSPSHNPQYCLKFAAARSWARAVKENLTESHRIASSFGGIYFNDDVWEVRMHFHDRNNLERSVCISDITYYNLVALIETEGYGLNDFMYFVRDPGVGITGMDEICDYDKVDEMLDHIANNDQHVVNLTVVRGTDPRPADLNSGYLVEEQVPLSHIGENPVYVVNPSGVLLRSPPKSIIQSQPEPLQFYTTQHNTNHDLDTNAVMDQCNAADQDELETLMELKRTTKIAKFRKHKIAAKHVNKVKQKLPILLTEDDLDLDADEDYLQRLNEMRKQREDPLIHFDGDTDVDEVYEEDEEGQHVEVEKEEQVEQDEQVEQQEVPTKKKKARKGPTERSHSSLEQRFEDV
ncbi:uncharacterized protein LOC125522975 [Triticum urartu]|uniref:uncharacterized protein LOC125518489 n=1 Tax=Triticum urartu TaxID=4572 RepID=UPI002042F8F0|nr:uncharacterized protein LOC125518489 [Triticum urartu]XP_048543976.1 uncharacterized protein LOC125522975 [Triticum urartu]